MSVQVADPGAKPSDNVKDLEIVILLGSNSETGPQFSELTQWSRQYTKK